MPTPYTEGFDKGITVRIAAAAPQVGDLEILDDSDEYTVYFGHNPHSHFMPQLMEGPDRDAQEGEALEDLLQYVGAILRDEVVIWSAPRGSGGTFGLQATPQRLGPVARAWLWSGRPYVHNA